MLKRKFRWEKAKVLYKYLIEENSLIKDSESAEDIFNEAVLFEIHISKSGNDWNYSYYKNLEAVQKAAENFK